MIEAHLAAGLVVLGGPVRGQAMGGGQTLMTSSHVRSLSYPATGSAMADIARHCLLHRHRRSFSSPVPFDLASRTDMPVEGSPLSLSLFLSLPWAWKPFTPIR